MLLLLPTVGTDTSPAARARLLVRHTLLSEAAGRHRLFARDTLLSVAAGPLLPSVQAMRQSDVVDPLAQSAQATQWWTATTTTTFHQLTTVHNFRHSSSSPRAADRKPEYLIQITGTYRASADYGYGPEDCDSALRVDRSTQELWGSLSIPGKIECVFHGEDAGAVHDGGITCRWRAQDLETGPFTFRRDCTASIEAQGDETRMVFYDLANGDNVSVRATPRTDSAPWVDVFRDEWDAIPRRAYGRR
jgi:hypothetical protein